LSGRHIVIISALALLLAGQAALAIATTSGTYDETTYLDFGRGLYGSLDAEPFADWGVAPLPVLVTSAAPVIAGSPGYPHAITLARVSAVVLFGVPLVALTYWTLLSAFGAAAAFAGAAFVSLSPNIVAHASLATTDVCFLASTLAVLMALARHLECASRRSCTLLGASLAVALAAKYSAVALFGIVAVASFAGGADGSESRLRRAVDALALAAGLFVVALLFVWALHAFALVPLGLPPSETARLPASIVGLARQLHHQSLGEPAFLLGRHSTAGWWYYMPAALAMKSTPAELVVGAAAFFALARGWRRAAPSALVWRIAFVVFGGFALLNHIALGVRYVLVLIPLSVFLAADLWFGRERADRRRLFAPTAIVALQIASAVAIAPHYLSYFNVFAGGPEHGYARLADSNVDWGQDLPALRSQLQRLGAKHVLLSYFGTAPVETYGIDADRWTGPVDAPLERWDWVAISATTLDGVFLQGDPFAAFRALPPAARAGYSILLYPTSRDDVRKAMAAAFRRQ
jgi:4-amino-4-deoxy-L-arabinose transferase-like glycosyltransferase